ncbi:hypothetical protein PC128_g24911 [Phytophthora cactorum]|nr:hypothetical protein PC128_g24911 [Phytophthora cactorum]
MSKRRQGTRKKRAYLTWIIDTQEPGGNEKDSEG